MKYIRSHTLKKISVHAFIFSIILLTGISTAHSAPPDAEMCAFLERFHGHTCPGSLMGLRLGLAAKEVLNAQGKITAKTFMLACSVDGIQIATGATLGNKAFTLEDRGEMFLILTDVETGKQVEARLTQEAMNRGKTFRELSSKARTMDDGSPEQSSIQKEADAVLDWFRTAPDSEVVTVKFLI
jgi:formylmethanofuran dehydrogenase subunit E